MIHPYFAYGTLRDPDLLATVLNRAPNPSQTLAAVAPGFRAAQQGHGQPMLIHGPGASTEGLVLLDLTAFEQDLIDAFLGPNYRRQTVGVIMDMELHEADTHLPVAGVPADSPDWSLRAWQETRKGSALAAARGTAADLRLRLIAIRPN